MAEKLRTKYMSSKAFRIPPFPLPLPPALSVSSEHEKLASILYEPGAIREARGRIYFSEEKEDVVRTELGEKRVGGLEGWRTFNCLEGSLIKDWTTSDRSLLVVF
jgi:hypothetical protein